MGCRFQDTGGITIGDGSLIGHGSTLTTLNHSLDPARRADMEPAPVRSAATSGWEPASRSCRASPSATVP